jgi:hypothetical protein
VCVKLQWCGVVSSSEIDGLNTKGSSFSHSTDTQPTVHRDVCYFVLLYEVLLLSLQKGKTVRFILSPPSYQDTALSVRDYRTLPSFVVVVVVIINLQSTIKESIIKGLFRRTNYQRTNSNDKAHNILSQYYFSFLPKKENHHKNCPNNKYTNHHKENFNVCRS